jgi:hypothetical protein
MFRRKPTFALIVAVLFALGAPVLAVTNPWLAEQNGLSILKAELPPCAAASQAQNRAFTVSNCVSATSCATTGTVTTRLVCDGTEWRALNAETSSGVAALKTVVNVTVADDAAGTKPTGAIPITGDSATCTCNDATGCTMSIAEPTVAAGYYRNLQIVSIGTGNCEFADSAGVTEIGSAIVLEPTSTVTLTYVGAAWYRLTTADNVP